MAGKLRNIHADNCLLQLVLGLSVVETRKKKNDYKSFRYSD